MYNEFGCISLRQFVKHKSYQVMINNSICRLGWCHTRGTGAYGNLGTSSHQFLSDTLTLCTLKSIPIKEGISWLSPPTFKIRRRPCILTHPTSLRYYVAGLLLSGSSEPKGPKGSWYNRNFGLDWNKNFFLKWPFDTTGPSIFWTFHQSWVYKGPRAGLDTVKLSMIYKKITRKQKHNYFFECLKSAWYSLDSSLFLLSNYCMRAIIIHRFLTLRFLQI